ncbi:MAG: hypothetical protein K9J16_02105 [Melioribacteraceae bacterium]|nr:hypothetical protein [Melioribacteraceae bacterium]MCF8355170.1 hypothetical protein [Melioribacteraceae bacterium]MCF8392499.1 hypothetical protein [Melioribacteraceae bacterium]MCF8418410.1 hypothetical protein [Melioribacteraceae bacterium]
MLERIPNINTEYGNNKRKSRKLNFSMFDSDNAAVKTMSTDSINLSPAALSFLRLNIFLKEFTKENIDEYSLIVNIDKYVFRTKVNVGKSLYTSSQPYEIINYKRDHKEITKASLVLSVFPGFLNTNSENEKLAIRYFDIVFERIKNLSIVESIERQESFAIKNLLDGIQDEFYYEISKLNTHIIGFLDKHLGIDLFNQLTKLKVPDNPLIIDKISTIIL